MSVGGPSEFGAPALSGAGEEHVAEELAPEGLDPQREPKPAHRRGGLGLQLESVLVALVLTIGIIAIGVALGAILVSQDVAGWIVGLVVATVSVVLSSILWSSRGR